METEEKEIKPIPMMWMVVFEKQKSIYPYLDTISRQKKRAIAKALMFVPPQENWIDLRKKGWRCVKIKLDVEIIYGR